MKCQPPLRGHPQYLHRNRQERFVQPHAKKRERAFYDNKEEGARQAESA